MRGTLRAVAARSRQPGRPVSACPEERSGLPTGPVGAVPVGCSQPGGSIGCSREGIMEKYVSDKSTLGRRRWSSQRSLGLLFAELCQLTGCHGGGADELRSLASNSTLDGGCLPAVCGENSGLVPFHKDAIHASLLWTKKSECPSMLIWMRPGEYKPRDYLNPTVSAVFPGFNPTYVWARSGRLRSQPARSERVVTICPGSQSRKYPDHRCLRAPVPDRQRRLHLEDCRAAIRAPAWVRIWRAAPRSARPSPRSTIRRRTGTSRRRTRGGS